MKAMRMALCVLAAGGALSFSACSDDDDPTEPTSTVYKANLSSANEVGTVAGNPTATGTATLTLATDNKLTVTVVVAGNLTSGVSMAHIHGPATATTNAGIVLDFVPSMTTVINSGVMTGTIVNATYDLNALPVEAAGVLRVTAASLISMLNAGTAYVNVHTGTNQGGEIRGTVVKQ